MTARATARLPARSRCLQCVRRGAHSGRPRAGPAPRRRRRRSGDVRGAIRAGLESLADPPTSRASGWSRPGSGRRSASACPCSRPSHRGPRRASCAGSGPPGSLPVAERAGAQTRSASCAGSPAGSSAACCRTTRSGPGRCCAGWPREADDWITVDTLATPSARGILLEPYRWAELEQLVYSPSAAGSAGSSARRIATIPFVDRDRRADARRSLARPGARRRS